MHEEKQGRSLYFRGPYARRKKQGRSLSFHLPYAFSRSRFLQLIFACIFQSPTPQREVLLVWSQDILDLENIILSIYILIIKK